MPRQPATTDSRLDELDTITETLSRQIVALMERVDALEAKAHEHQGGRPPKVAE